MQLTEILTNPIVIAVVALVAGMLIHRYASKQAPGQIAQTIEADAFGLLVKGVQKLSDTRPAEAKMEAARQEIAMQLAHFDHFVTIVNGLAAGRQPAQAPQQPPQPPAAS